MVGGYFIAGAAFLSSAQPLLSPTTPTDSANVPASPVGLTANAPAMPFLAAPLPPERRGKLDIWWKPSTDTNTIGYRLYYGTNQGVYTDVLNVGSVTNAAITGLNEGTRYYVVARAYNADFTPGFPSNEGSAVTGIYISMAQYSWTIQAYGLLGRTNRMQVSTNMANWRTILTWMGNGQLTNALHTNSAFAWFRVVAN